MADSTIDSELFFLQSGMWGMTPQSFGSVPLGGFKGSIHHNVATPTREAGGLGDCRAVFCDGTVGKAGWAEFGYFKVGTQNAGNLIAEKSVCVQDSATVPYVLTNDPDDCIALLSGPIAIAISAMTDAYYGWFWIGGVCPEQYVSELGGNYATDSNVVAGWIMQVDLTADAIGFGTVLKAGTDGKNWQAVGMALAADA